MGSAALTIWFCIATLFGPALCCCNLTAAEAPKAAPAPKPAKSCCSHESVPIDEKPAPKEKPKCPCGQGKATADAALSNGAESDDDVAGQLLGAEIAFAGPSPIPFRTASPIDSVERPALPSHPLSGRALLAAYSTLRC